MLPPRWVVAVSFAVAAAILGDSLLYAVLPAVWPGLGLRVELVGVLLSVNRFVRVASNPLAGWVMGRVGARGPFLAAVFLAAATTAVYGLRLGFAALLLARLWWGVCWSFLRLGGYLAALEAAGDENRGYYLGFFNGVTRLGSFFAVLTGGLLTDLLGFTSTAFLFAGATVAAGVAVLRERPPQPIAIGLPVSRGGEHPGARAHVPSDDTTSPQSTAAPEASGLKSIGRLADSSRLLLWTVYGAIFVDALLVSGLVTATLGLLLITRFGQSMPVLSLTLGAATLSGWLLSARFLSDFGWGPLSGHLSDRLGRLPVLLGAVGLEGVGLVALAGATELPSVVLCSLLLFLAASCLRVSLDAIAGDLASQGQRARTMSWYATYLDLGSAFGPLGGYLLAAQVGLDGLYRSGALLLLATGLVCWVVFRSAR